MAEEELEPLVTECPECHTRFRVDEKQLEMARGRVRCGACLSVFVATRHLIFGTEPSTRTDDGDVEKTLDDLLDELGDQGVDTLLTEPEPEAGSEQTEAETEVEAEPQDELEEVPEVAPPEPLEPGPLEVSESDPELPVETETEEPAASSETSDQFDKLLETFATEDLIDTEYGLPDGSRDKPKRRWWMIPAIAIAALALVFQVLWFQYDEWSKDTRFRPVYGALCKALDCELPVMRDLSEIVSRNLVVRSHPERQNVLVVDALIVNEADFPQPFPTIELRFSSTGGHLVAGQRFRPSEYLAGDLRGLTLFQPLTPVHITLEIEDPGADAVNYRMTFK